MAWRQAPEQLLLEFRGPLFLLILAPGAFVEVPLSRDRRILEGIGPGAELAGTGGGTGNQVCNLRFEIGGGDAAEFDAEHGAGLAGGTAGHIQKNSSSLVVPLEALAMLLETERAARSSWSRKAGLARKAAVSRRSSVSS
jgi:hypothetical protein